MKFCSPLLSMMLVPLVAASPLMAQVPVSAQTPESASVSSLQIEVVDSDPNPAPAGSRSTKGIAVEIKDAGGAPVANAALVFRLPDTASSATFADGSRAAIAYSDAAGRARVNEIRWGTNPGTVALRVTANKGAAHAGLLIDHEIAAPAAPALAMSAPLPHVADAPPAKRQDISAFAVSPAADLSPSAPSITIEHVGGGRKASAPPQLLAASRPLSPGVPPPTATAPSATDVDSPDANVPLRHAFGAGTALGEAPAISIANTGSAPATHSKKKWIIAVAAAAGAGAAFAMVNKGKGGSPSTSGVTIGAPTISVGHP